MAVNVMMAKGEGRRQQQTTELPRAWGAEDDDESPPDSPGSTRRRRRNSRNKTLVIPAVTSTFNDFKGKIKFYDRSASEKLGNFWLRFFARAWGEENKRGKWRCLRVVNKIKAFRLGFPINEHAEGEQADEEKKLSADSKSIKNLDPLSSERHEIMATARIAHKIMIYDASMFHWKHLSLCVFH